MSRMTEKVIQEFHQFLAKKAPQGPKDDEELQHLMDEFFTQYNELIQDDDAINSMDVYDYLEMADKAITKRKKKEYLAQAAALEPNNMDVKLAQAETDAKSPLDLIAALPALIQEEREHLKQQQIYNHSKGDFWLVFETRPYMRLLQRYMMALIECGVTNRAIQIGEEMLRLNENDNQGIRFSLIALYAQSGNEMKALQLYKHSPEEKDSPSYLLPLALLYFKLGEWDKAKSYLKTLKQTCSGTKKFLHAVKTENEYVLHDMYNPMGYRPGTISELLEHYFANLNVYDCEPYFFAWADKALVVHRKKKE